MISHFDRALIALVVWGSVMFVLALGSAAYEAWLDRHQKPRRRSSW